LTQIGIFVLKIPITSGNPVSVVILGNIPENYSQPERRLIWWAGTRVARWFVFKPKIPNWANFGVP
jgi:hypothetical protein